jgi:[ribosomal protein S18]-alanine N-acetyltransferase
VDALIMRLQLTGPAFPESEREAGNHASPEAGQP